MLHPHTELRFISETMGSGVFAARLIPKGTITWVRDDFDQAFTVEQVERMLINRCGFSSRKRRTWKRF
jgi:uncharacterized protein